MGNNSFKLSWVSKVELKKKEKSLIEGKGVRCGCACKGSFSDFDNGSANYDGGPGIKKGMMKLFRIFIFSGILYSLVSCKAEPAEDGALTIKHRGNDTLWECNFLKVEKKLTELSLSKLVKSLHYIKLEEKQEALIRGGRVNWKKKVIGIKPVGRDVPYKLFRKDGTFLSNIGSQGHGPHEYINVYADFIDEEKERVYLAPFPGNQILCYDFSGGYQGTIPLAYKISKMNFYIEDGIVTVFQIPFREETKSIVYRQDFAGNVVDEIDAAPYAIKADFSHELNQNYNAGRIDYCLTEWACERPDTLYYYRKEKNVLSPAFVVNFGNYKIPWHCYHDLPSYYILEIIKMGKGQWGWVGAQRNYIFVDKKNRTSRYVKLKNDFWGGIEADIIDPSDAFSCFHHNMYLVNLPALTLKERLEKVLPSLSGKKRDELQRLYESIDENGNNYILYGEIKQ